MCARVCECPAPAALAALISPATDGVRSRSQVMAASCNHDVGEKWAQLGSEAERGTAQQKQRK